jgi:hypothetical protein
VFTRWELCNEGPKSRGTNDRLFEPDRGMGLDFSGATVVERKRQLDATMKGRKQKIVRNVLLTKAPSGARVDCTLNRLNGAALVIYGFPVRQGYQPICSN